MSAAWHTAALGRVKKFPKLKEILSAPQRKRRQTMEEQIKIAQQWTAALARKR